MIVQPIITNFLAICSMDSWIHPHVSSVSMAWLTQQLDFDFLSSIKASV